MPLCVCMWITAYKITIVIEKKKKIKNLKTKIGSGEKRRHSDKNYFLRELVRHETRTGIRERVSTAAEPARRVRWIRLAREGTSTSGGRRVQGRRRRGGEEWKKNVNRKTRQTASPISAQLKYSARGRRHLVLCRLSLPTTDHLDVPRRPPLRPPDTVVRFSFFTPSPDPSPDRPHHVRLPSASPPPPRDAVFTCGRGFYPAKRVRPPPCAITASRCARVRWWWR